MRPKYSYQDLTPESNLEAFKCAEGDLNDFFRFFTDADKDDDTRLMYFDLKDFE